MELALNKNGQPSEIKYLCDMFLATEAKIKKINAEIKKRAEKLSSVLQIDFEQVIGDA